MNTTILDVGIGLVVIYLVLAFVCTSVNEYIAQVLALRAETLWRAIHGLFGGDHELTNRLYRHNLINALSPTNPMARPSYIPSHVFSLALVDELKIHSAGKSQSVAQLLEGVKDVDPRVLEVLRPLADAAGTNIDRFRVNIETWFDSAMERASGWYKKKVQKTIFWVAFGLALITNADSLMLVDTLWSSPTVRAQMAATGVKLAEEGNKAQAAATGEAATTESAALTAEQLSEAREQVDKLLGWSGPILWWSDDYDSRDPHRFPRGTEWFNKFFGLLVTAFAASLGAPFWFDMLNKIINIRSAGSSPVEKPRRPSDKPQPQTRIASAAGDQGSGAAAGSASGATSAATKRKPAAKRKPTGGQ